MNSCVQDQRISAVCLLFSLLTLQVLTAAPHQLTPIFEHVAADPYVRMKLPAHFERTYDAVVTCGSTELEAHQPPPAKRVYLFDHELLTTNPVITKWQTRLREPFYDAFDARPDVELEQAIAAIADLKSEMASVSKWKAGHCHLFYNHYTPGKPLPAVGETLLAKMFRHSGATDATDVLLIEYLKEIEERVFLPHLQIDAPLDSADFKYGAPAKSGAVGISWIETTWQSMVSFFKSLLGIEEVSREVPVISKDPAFAKHTPVFRDLRSAEILHSVEKTALEMAHSSQAKNRALYYTAAAYLEIMKKDFESAAQNLSKAKTLLPDSSSQVFTQAVYLELLSAVRQTEKMTPELEKMILACRALYLSQWHQRLLWTEIAKIYLKNGQIPHAAMAFSAGGADHAASGLIEVYASFSDLHELLRKMQKTDQPDFKQIVSQQRTVSVYEPYRTAFEKLLCDQFDYTTDEIREVIVTRLMQEGKFEEALTALEAIDDAHWHINKTDYTDTASCFTGTYGFWVPQYIIHWHGMMALSANKYSLIKKLGDWNNPDDPDIYTLASTAALMLVYEHIPLGVEADTNKIKKVSKPVFLRKIVELKKKAEAASGEKAAQYYFELANALRYSKQRWRYNASLWNTGYLPGDCSRSGLQGFLQEVTPGGYPFNVKEFATGFYNRKMEFVRQYGSSSLANGYYQKAASLSKDSGLVARALESAR